MPPRLSHKKSRNGCLECKKRRVKCDERNPKCSNCIRHEKPCIRPLKFVIASNSANGKLSDGADNPEPLKYSSLDLELLHWFTISTSSTLNFGPGAERTWSLLTVNQALKFEFLMRALIGVSALHKSIENVEERDSLLNKATSSMNRSLNLVKPHLESPDDKNCHALFSFSALISIYAVGYSGHHHEPTDSAIQKFMEALSLIRGSANVANEESISAELRSKEGIRSFFQSTTRKVGTAISNPRPTAYSLLSVLGDQEDDQYAILQEAIEGLDQEIESLMQTEHNLFSLKWLVHISDDFVQMIDRKDIRALAIVAGFAPLMQDLHSAWIYGSWNHWLGGEIVSYLVGTPWLEPVSRLVLDLEVVIRDLKKP